MVLLQVLASKQIRQLKFYWSNLRVGKIVLVLIIYSTGGAAMFHLIESQMSDSIDLAFGPGCLGTKGYWAALNYVNTLYSTIGYGSVYCCTWLGRLLSCIYIFVGAPMVLVVLEALGKILARTGTKLWTLGLRAVDRVRPAPIDIEKAKPKSSPEDDDDEDDIEELIPLSAGLTLSMIWMLTAGLYFSYVEGWPYASSLYFLWISITTVGLGDFAPTRFEFTIIDFTLLFIGLAFMSMCVAILQAKIENMIKRMQADIKRQQNGLPPRKALKTAQNSPGVFGKFIGNPEEKLMKMMMTTNQVKAVKAPAEVKKRKIQSRQTQTKELQSRGRSMETQTKDQPRPVMNSMETQTMEPRKREKVCDHHLEYLREESKPPQCSCIDSQNSIPCLHCMPKMLVATACVVCQLKYEVKKDRRPQSAASRTSQRSNSLDERPKWQYSYQPD